MSTEMSTDWKSRTRLIFGDNFLQVLEDTRVLVVGLGGVGSWAAEHLVRSGVGKVSVVDNDTISPSNINRQSIALHSTLGKKKIEVTAERLQDINPALSIKTYDVFVNDNTIHTLPAFDSFDFVLDCIDTLAPKIAVIQSSLNAQIPLISSLGSAGKSDPSCIQISDINKSFNCPLGRMLQKRLHKIGIYDGFSVVFSTEEVDKSKLILENGKNKRSNAGSISTIPALFGTLMAAEVINRCIVAHNKQ